MSEANKDRDEPKTSPAEEEYDPLGEDDHLYDDWDDLASDPEEVSRLQRTLEGLLPDIVKRGVDGLISEDGIRSVVREKGLPREAVGFILGQVDATKREVLRIVSKEMRLFLENVDLGGELTKILTSVSFEIRTEVRFIPNDAALKPDVRNRVRVRGKDGDEVPLSEDSEPVDDDDTGSTSTDDEQGEASLEAEDSQEEEPRRRRWGLGRRKNKDEGEGGDEDGDDDTTDD